MAKRRFDSGSATVKPAIIFGGEGFIGRHLAENLITKGHPSVTSVDLAASSRRQGAIRKFIAADVRQPLSSIEVAGAPVLWNLAAVHRTPGHPDNEYFETNLKGAENICALARKTGAQTIVFTSSIAPYGASESLKSEDTIPMPNSPYGISKLVAEHIHKEWQAEDPTVRRLAIVRPGVVFGAGEGGNFTRLYAALAKRRFVYPGRKDTIKACIYVKDVAALLADMAERKEPGTFTYNLTIEPAPSIEEICMTLAKVTGVAEPKLVLPGAAMKIAAGLLASVQGFAGEGFHPDRVRKLMISNNISGAKLPRDGYRLKFSLAEAIADWWSDCGQQGLT